MAELFSPAWIAAADAAVAAADLRSAEPLVIQNEIAGDDGTVRIYHVEVAVDGARVRTGAHAEPTVVYRLSVATAAGIATGSIDPYAEFMAGRLAVSGDSTRLVGHRELIDTLQEAMATASG